MRLGPMYNNAKFQPDRFKTTAIVFSREKFPSFYNVYIPRVFKITSGLPLPQDTFQETYLRTPPPQITSGTSFMPLP